MKKTSKEIEDKVIELSRNSSLSKKEIARMTEIDPTTVSRILKRNNINKENVEPTYISEVISLYKNGKNCKEIGEMFNVNECTIANWLKKKGVQIRHNNVVNWTLEEVIDAYNNGESLTKMAKRLNTTRNAIARHLKKAGVNVVNKWNQCKFNENVFDVIDTEEKAYWLGFIYADGYISHNKNESNKNKFEITLNIDDIAHLHKFNNFMEYNGDNVKIKSVKSNNKIINVCRWTITNKHLWDTLNSLGCTPQKSLTLEFPAKSTFKDKSLIRHFIRGYWDGDGCISYANTSHDRPAIQVLGTKSMLDGICDNLIWESINYIQANYNSENTITLELSKTGTIATFILYALYYKSNIYLERKFQKFLYFKDCRFKAKALKLLEGKIREGWDANPELIADIKELQQCNA